MSFEDSLALARKQAALADLEKKKKKQSDEDDAHEEAEAKKRRAEVIKRSPEWKQIEEFVESRDFLQALQAYVEACGISWEVVDHYVKKDIPRGKGIVDKVMNGFTEETEVPILREVTLQDEERLKREDDIEGKTYIAINLPKGKRYGGKKFFKYAYDTNAIRLTLFLFKEKIAIDNYDSEYYGESISIFFNKEDINEVVEGSVNSTTGGGDHSFINSHIVSGELIMSKGIVIVYDGMSYTPQEFYEYIAKKIIDAG